MPTRLLPCPVCGAEVLRFMVKVGYSAARPVRIPGMDEFEMSPCGHRFTRVQFPDWVATFASEGG